jgi:hypothetical protein
MSPRRTTAVALLACLTACYTYGPATPTARGGQRVQVFLNDRGRSELGRTVGAGTRSIAGDVTTAGDSALTLSVTMTRSIDGTEYPWTGEQVTVPLAMLDSVRVQRVSVVRSTLAAAAFVAAIAAIHGAFGVGSTGGRNPSPIPTPQ